MKAQRERALKMIKTSAFSLLLFGTAAHCSWGSEGDLAIRLAQTVDAFYDLRLDEAIEAARAIERDFPGHPAGPFYLSMVHYQRYLVEDPPSRGTLKAFEAENQRTIKSCEAIGDSDPISAQRYLGAAYGFHARVLIAQGHFLAALPKARKAIGHLRRAIELDPSDDDAALGIGMYEYFMSRVPAAAKPISYLFVGMWGNRERGLKSLHRAAEGSGPSRMEARSVLAAIYGSDRERRWPQAQELLKELIARYPGNPLFRLRSIYVAERSGDCPKASALADAETGWVEKLPVAIRERARGEALSRTAECKALISGQPQHIAPFRWPLPTLPEPKP